MNSRQFLEQAILLEQSIATCTASIEHYDELAHGGTAIRYDRDGTMTQRSQNAPFELPMCEKADLERMEREERRELWEKLREIRHVVTQIVDGEVQNIVRMRFLANKTETVIACQFGISVSTVRRRLERGYHEVSLITGYPEPPRQRMPSRERHTIGREMLRRYTEE